MAKKPLPQKLTFADQLRMKFADGGGQFGQTGDLGNQAAQIRAQSETGDIYNSDKQYNPNDQTQINSAKGLAAPNTGSSNIYGGSYAQPTTGTWGNLQALPGYSQAQQEQAFNLNLNPQSQALGNLNNKSNSFINQLNAQASGQAPSLASAQLAQAGQQGLQAQLAAAVGTRGQGIAQAQRNAAYGIANQNQQLAQAGVQAGLANQLQNQQMINQQMGLQGQNIGQQMTAQQAMQQAQQNYMQYVTQQQEAAAGQLAGYNQAITQQGLANQGSLNATKAGSIVGQGGSLFSGLGNFAGSGVGIGGNSGSLGGMFGFKDGGVVKAADGLSIQPIQPLQTPQQQQSHAIPTPASTAGGNPMEAYDTYKAVKGIYDYLSSAKAPATSNLFAGSGKGLHAMSGYGTGASTEAGLATPTGAGVSGTAGPDALMATETGTAADTAATTSAAEGASSEAADIAALAHDGHIYASEGYDPGDTLNQYGLNMWSGNSPTSIISSGDKGPGLVGGLMKAFGLKDGGVIPQKRSFASTIKEKAPITGFEHLLAARLRLKKLKGEV